MPEDQTITALLGDLGAGDRGALDALLLLAYDRLRRIPSRQLRGERAGHSLSTTALVNEAYLELVGLERIRYRDRAHFLAIAARMKRRILVGHAVRRKAAK